MIEYLATCGFGFYFTFGTDCTTNPYGSRDLACALTTMNDPFHKLSSQNPFQSMVADQLAGENGADQFGRWNQAWSHNLGIAERVLETLVLARVLVCERFLEVATKNHFGSTEAIRRAWCLLQITPHIFGTGDIFLQVFRRVSILSARAAADEYDEAMRRIEERYGISDIALAVDEAQTGTATYEFSFGPRFHKADVTAFRLNARPVLKPVIQVLESALAPRKILISGTKIKRNAIFESLLAGAGTTAQESPDPVMLGDMSSDDKLGAFVDHFLSNGFWARLGGRTRREIACWLSGRRAARLNQNVGYTLTHPISRHRWMATFMACLLRAGPSDQCIMNLINALVSRLSGYSMTTLVADGEQDRFGLEYVHGHILRLLNKDVIKANSGTTIVLFKVYWL